MNYNPNIHTLAAKYRQFFSDPTPGQILAVICPYTIDTLEEGREVMRLIRKHSIL